MEKRKITTKEIWGFASYSFLMYFGIMPPLMFLNAFLTEQLLLPAAFVASFLLFARIVDFGIGVSAGGIIQKANLKWGKYRSWFVIGRFTYIVGLLMQFTYSVALPNAAKAAIVIVGYIIMHGTMDFVSPATYGMIGVMSGSDLEARNKLTFASVRAGSVGNILYSLTFVPILTFFSGTALGPGWAYTVTLALGAGLMIIGLTVSSNIAKPYDVQKVTVAGTPAPPKVTLGDMAKSVVQNGQLLVLFMSQTFANIGAQVLQALMVYYFLFILGNMALLTIALTVSTMFGVVGAIIGPMVGVKLGKKWAMVIGMALSAVATGLIAMFADLGLWYYIGFSCFNALAMAFFRGFGQQYWLDCGEYGYWKSGKDNRAVALALGNVPIKIGFMFGGSIGMYALALIGYTPAMVPTPEFASAFMIILGGIPAAFYVVATIIMAVGYKIKDSDIAMYTEENLKREADMLEQTAKHV